MTTPNIDPEEIKKFNALATTWWDTEGPLRTLHDINPVRLAFIQEQVALNDKKVLDVGCGGGILAESLAKAQAHVTAIDMDPAALETARQHAQTEGLVIAYQQQTIESMALTDQTFDIITCMEMIEHVPDPEGIIRHCAALLKPQGYLFVSTLNRHPKAYLMAILGAEYILRLLPRGTHDYQKFVQPAELGQWARMAGLETTRLTGVSYHPFTRKAKLTANLHVNYMACFQKRAE
jgi:2-polyprenyl-6-hydroxyphenyl methylase / 3-demethylubiquinone-9 3-methyltransferase